MLRRLAREQPGDLGTQADLLTILKWAGKPEEAVMVYEQLTPDVRGQLPEYALIEVALAYRDVGRSADAEVVARAGWTRFGTTEHWTLRLAQVLTDQHKADEAAQIMEPLLLTEPASVDRWLVWAYVQRTRGDALEWLRGATSAAALAPDNLEAREGEIMALEALGGASRALELADRYPKALDAAARRRIEATMAAVAVRRGTIGSDDPRRRFDRTDEAIRRLEHNLARFRAAGPEGHALVRQTRFDRMVAWRDRFEMRKVVAEYEQLHREQIEMPGYVQEAAADAYLYLRQPETAEVLYRAILAIEPHKHQTRLSLFYALIDQDRLREAYAVIDALQADTPVWTSFIDFTGARARYDNPEHLDAVRTAALARYYGDQVQEAWRRIASLAALAPANGALRNTQGSIAHGRGWLRRAEEEYRLAATLDPDNKGSAVGLADIATARHRFAEARQRIAELHGLYPEDLGIQRLGRDFQNYDRWRLEVNYVPQYSEGPQTEGLANTLTTELTSPLLKDAWQVFTQFRWADAHVPEGLAELRRYALGGRFWFPDGRVEAGVTWNEFADQEPGAFASFAWNITDQWAVSGKAERLSQDTPLRALLQGITSDRLQLGVSWRFHESREIALSAAVARFSDDNVRGEFNGRATQRLVDIPHFDLLGSIEVSTSANSKRDTIYYNPKSDLSAGVALDAQHILRRRYQWNHWHRLQVSAGLYDEAGFETDWYAAVRYEQHLEWNPRHALVIGVEVARRVFDGDAERWISPTLSFITHF
jgi:biofilm PGA synthesis protein PgaA